jgi:hypothetical protein
LGKKERQCKLWNQCHHSPFQCLTCPSPISFTPMSSLQLRCDFGNFEQKFCIKYSAFYKNCRKLTHYPSTYIVPNTGLQQRKSKHHLPFGENILTFCSMRTQQPLDRMSSLQPGLKKVAPVLLPYIIQWTMPRLQGKL